MQVPYCVVQDFVLLSLQMAFQVDYLAIGEGEQSGDALALRYGDLDANDPSKQTVVIIDGGTKESGKQLVDLVKNQYGTTYVDYVFSTHLDRDHLSGLTEVIEHLEVGTLYMHVPWEHLDETNPLFVGDFSNDELEQELKESLELVHEVEQLAIEKGIPIEEPFFGTPVNNEIIILGPTKAYYEELLCQFRETPDLKTTIERILDPVFRAAEPVLNLIRDRFDLDILGEGGSTSAENNSSVVLLMLIDSEIFLFTGDAGVPALTKVADFADALKLPLTNLNFLHVPHHGSKNNLSTSLLKRIRASICYVSASKGSSKHPSKRVLNALKKVNSRVFSTQGMSLLYHSGQHGRGWGTPIEHPFYEEFEE